TKTGMVVESLADGKRFTAFAHQRISSLEEISIYTYGEDLPLKQVFARMFTHLSGQPAPDPRDPALDLRTFMEEIVEDYDQERVYASDIRKMVSWYNLLLLHGLVDAGEDEGPTGGEADAGASETQDTESPEQE
ncbi:MAG TPA: DUF5606 domain-containing protein, partial [Bacteroidales bacterium]|nr:DUF5606 domain-containing protein [Bacteroidales bacterium]